MIGIIFIGDIKYCPYLDKYTDEIIRNNEDYEVLYWAREKYSKHYKNNNSSKFIPFYLESSLSNPPHKKMLGFYKFRKWLVKKIKQNKYEKLIILSTLSGIIINDLLLKEYKNKYIFDIRDYSYEHNKLFYLIEEKLIKHSYFTSISSEGFKSFLPPFSKYLIVHNFNSKEVNMDNEFKKDVVANPLTVVWNGTLRYFDHQKHIIDHFSKDDRFKLVYHGIGPEYDTYIKYCRDMNIENVTFTGEYNNNDKHELIKGAHIINNSYISHKHMETKYAISNKFYDGVIYKIPQLVELDSYKFDLVMKYGVGFGIDVKVAILQIYYMKNIWNYKKVSSI